MRRRFIAILVLAAIVDRVIKLLALSGASGDWWIARFGLFKNYHLVFSLPLSNTVAIGLMLTALAVVGWLGWRAAKRHDDRGMFAISLIMLGALSNLFDRLRFGYVVDWADFGRWWPVFNLADVMIAVGVVWLLAKKRPGLTNLRT